MAGTPGTPRFGMYDDDTSKTQANGDSVLRLQDGSSWNEEHFMYNPAQLSRPMGTTGGGVPGEYYQQTENQYNAPCNHDGFFGGDVHLLNLDERKVLATKIMSIPVRCADDFETLHGSKERIL